MRFPCVHAAATTPVQQRGVLPRSSPPIRISLPRKGYRVGPHIVLFGDCSAFTRVAARTLAQVTNSWPAIRRLQTFRLLHACSGCFRLERCRRVGLAPTGKRRLVTAHAINGSRQPAVRHRDYSGEPAFMWASRIFIRSSRERRPSSSSMAEWPKSGIKRKESALTRWASAILPAPT